jgi:hypothetical protein
MSNEKKVNNGVNFFTNANPSTNLTLHDHIFGTPFGINGKKGRSSFEYKSSSQKPLKNNESESMIY